MRLKSGQYVRHSKYGWGTILEGDGRQTMVYFNSVGVKKFATSLAVFQVVEGEPGAPSGGAKRLTLNKDV